MKKTAAFVMATVVLLGLLVGCGTNISEPPSVAPTSEESIAPIADSWKQFETTDLEGTAVSYRDFSENTLTVFNVWGTWCPPCVKELPYLQEVSAHYDGKGVQIVGVLQDGVTDLGMKDERTVADAQTLLDNAGATYLNLLPDDVLTSWLIAKMQYYPTTYFVDKNGDVVKTAVGANSVENWKMMIDEILEELG